MPTAAKNDIAGFRSSSAPRPAATPRKIELTFRSVSCVLSGVGSSLSSSAMSRAVSVAATAFVELTAAKGSSLRSIAASSTSAASLRRALSLSVSCFSLVRRSVARITFSAHSPSAVAELSFSSLPRSRIAIPPTLSLSLNVRSRGGDGDFPPVYFSGTIVVSNRTNQLGQPKLTPESDRTARKAFAKRLNAHIARSNLSHRRLAARARVAPQSITNWTQAKVEPNLRQLRGLSGALGVPVAALVEDDDPPPPSVERRILSELMALDLRPAVERLSDSAPTLLDLLAEAERLIVERKDS